MKKRYSEQPIIGFSNNDPVWDHPIFTKNRHRLLDGDVARGCFAQVPGQASWAGLQPAGADQFSRRDSATSDREKRPLEPPSAKRFGQKCCPAWFFSAFRGVSET